MSKWHEVGSLNTLKPKDDGTKRKGYTINIRPQKKKDGSLDKSGLKELADRILNCGEHGVYLQLEKPENEIKRLNELGFIEDEDLEFRLDSVPDWKKYNIKLPPPRDDD